MKNILKLTLLVIVTCTTGCVSLRGGGNAYSPRTEEALAKGRAALFARQHDDGSWGGDEVKVQSSHKSDYPVAISALAQLALLATAPANRGANESKRKSLGFVFDTIDDQGTMRNTRDNTPKIHERNVWSQAFALFVSSRLLAADTVSAEEKAKIRVNAKKMISALAKTQQTDGGWTYNRAPSDVMLTGTVLMGLAAIRDAGVAVPPKLIGAPAMLLEAYSAPGCYVAYKAKAVPDDRKGKIGDSLGRSVLLELALVEAGHGSRKRLRAAVETFFLNRERLDQIRDLEEGCHQPPHGIGTFYCFYSYFYIAHAVEELGGRTKRQYRPVLVEHFLGLQKKDGHWIDSKDHCGESYGTAMGMLVLAAPSWSATPRQARRTE